MAMALTGANGQPMWGFAFDGMPNAQRIEALENTYRLPMQWVNFFLQWPGDPGKGEFPREALNAVWERGAVPVLTWEPMWIDKDGKERMIAGSAISNGDYDVYIDRMARAAKEADLPLVIRFGHEMNIARYHWGADAFDAESPVVYKKMFRYVVERFRKIGVNNVAWAFCPNVDSIPAEPEWNKIAAYYPGNDVVDVVGLDGYNWGTTRNQKKHGWTSKWRSFSDLFGSARAEVLKVAGSKPFLVFETSCATEGGNKAEWLRDAVKVASEWDLAAVIWFEVEKENDWRLGARMDAGSIRDVRQALSPAMALFPKR